MTEFFMAMEPPTVTHQEHKVTIVNGRPVFYDPPELKAAKEKLIGNLYKYRIMEPYRTGVRLITKWCFPKKNHKSLIFLQLGEEQANPRMKAVNWSIHYGLMIL